MPSFSRSQKLAVMKRDGCCVPCTVMYGRCQHSNPDAGPEDSGLVIHHRAGRGMGSARSLNVVSNGLATCYAMNDRVERDAALAGQWRAHGWLLSRNALAQPRDVPVDVITGGVQRRVLLDDEGSYRLIGGRNNEGP